MIITNDTLLNPNMRICSLGPRTSYKLLKIYNFSEARIRFRFQVKQMVRRQQAQVLGAMVELASDLLQFYNCIIYMMGKV